MINNYDYSKEKIFNDVEKYLNGEIELDKEIDRYSLNTLVNIKIKEETSFKQAYDAYEKIKKEGNNLKREANLTAKFLHKFKQWQICYAMEVIMSYIKDYFDSDYILDSKVIQKYKNQSKSYKLLLLGLKTSALRFSLYKAMQQRCIEKGVKIEGYTSRLGNNDFASRAFLPK